MNTKYERIVEVKSSDSLYIGLFNTLAVIVVIIGSILHGFDFWSGLWLGLNVLCAVFLISQHFSKENRIVYYNKFTLERGESVTWNLELLSI